MPQGPLPFRYAKESSSTGKTLLSELAAHLAARPFA